MMIMERNFDEISDFLQREIVPQYDAFDAGHQRSHVLSVMATSQHLAQYYPEVDRAMLLVAAAYHDLGLSHGRKEHHTWSARILRADERLLRWFTPQEIEVMADAAEDHRASLGHAPRTIYGRLVAESDRQIDPATVIRRALQYGLAHYPGLDREAQYRRLVQHMQEKYAPGGYLHLWIPESDNAKRLAELRKIIANPEQLRQAFEQEMLKINENDKKKVDFD